MPRFGSTLACALVAAQATVTWPGGVASAQPSGGATGAGGASGAATATATAPASASASASAPAPAPALASASAPDGAGETESRVVTLEEVERAAVDHQPQMVVARAATHIAEAEAEQARAPLLPQVTASASYTRTTGNFAARPGAVPQINTMLPSPSLTTSYDYWNAGVTGTQLIYDFGQTFERYRAAESTADAQRIAERTTVLQVLSLVRRTYFAVRAAKDLVNVARQTLDSQNRHLVQVQGFVTVGTQPPIALAQQQAAVANAKVQLITAENNYETAKAQLNQAAGLTWGTDYTVSDEEFAPVPGEDEPSAALAAQAIAARPELATFRKERESQLRAIRSAQGGYGPSLSAAASVTEAGPTLGNLVPNWQGQVLLTWPIFQGGLTAGQVHQAKAGLESIDGQESLEELQIRLDVDSARLAVRAAKTSVGAADDAVTSARDQLRLAEQRFATGVGSIIELTDAQVTYTSAEAQAVQARYNLSSARALLLAALGRT